MSLSYLIIQSTSRNINESDDDLFEENDEIDLFDDDRGVENDPRYVGQRKYRLCWCKLRPVWSGQRRRRFRPLPRPYI